MRYARSGRARINTRHPQAMGECDISGFWYPLANMRRKFEWAGNSLVDTGLLVGPDQLDKPQDQYRSLILPPDPRPVQNPRPSPNVTGYGPVYGLTDRPYGVDEAGTDPYGVGRFLNRLSPPTPGNYGLTQLIVGGASVAPYVPLTKFDVLTKVAEMTGIPVPQQFFDRSIRIRTQNQSYMIMGTQPARGWFLIYNPTNPQAQVALSPTTPPIAVPPDPADFVEGSLVVRWGEITNLILGPGEAYFAAWDQGLGAPFRGALSVIGLIPGMDFWAWESGSPWLWLTDDNGQLVTDDWGQAILIGSEDGVVGSQDNAEFYDKDGILGLIDALNWPTRKPPGPAVWNNLGIASVGPGSKPNPRPPILFGEITPLELQLLGGNDLPWVEPTLKNQLWNPGGALGGDIWIAPGIYLQPRGYGTGGFGTFGFGGTRPL